MAASGSDDEGGLISAINVTPLVDVTLVLLIIFMVTAKIIVSQGMPMDLPKAASGENLPQQVILSVELTESGKTFVDSQQVANDEIVGQLAQKARKENQDLRAVIRADQKVPHGRVIQVLDMLKTAKITKIAFGVSPKSGKDPDADDAEGAK